MANQYGIKEVADVTFYDISTGDPVFTFDSLSVSNIENAAETVEATGGRGNATLVRWDFGRTATLTMQDALISLESLGLLAGNVVEDYTGQLDGSEMVNVDGTDATAPLEQEGLSSVSYFDDEGVIQTAVVGGVGELEGATDVASGFEGVSGPVRVYYRYDAPEGTKAVTFSTDKFPGQYRVVGETIARDANTGVDKAAQFVIPKASLQSGFTFTMDAANPSVFDFTMSVLKDSASTDLYKILITE